MGRARVTYGQGKGGTEIHIGLKYRELNRPTGRPRYRHGGNIEVDCQYNRRAWTKARNFGFHNMQAFSSVTEELLASQEDPWSIALVGLCMPQNAATG